MKHLGIYAAVFFLSACGNPGGISDSEYAKYKELGAPKILYSCNTGFLDTTAFSECLKLKDDPSKIHACVEKAERETKPIIDVGYAAGVGVAVTYNKLLREAKDSCDGEFKVLDSKN